MTKFHIFYFFNSICILCYILLSIFTINACISFGSVKFLKKFTNNKTNLIKNKFKKDYFIWIMIDDIAFEEFYLINNLSRNLNLSKIFRVKTKEFKLSSSLYNSIYTGKINRNYLGKKLSGDNILYQVHKNGKIVFKGEAFPNYSLLDSKFIDKFEIYENINFIHPKEFDNDYLENLYQEFYKLTDNFGNFKDKSTRKLIYEKILNVNPIDFNNYSLSYLNEILENNVSSIFYFKSDKTNYITSLVNTFKIEYFIIDIIKYLNLNPQYNLIVSSEHSGQEYSYKEGNEGIFFIYSDIIKKEKNDSNNYNPLMTIYDIAPTISTILNNVNIPLESSGFPQFILEDSDFMKMGINMKIQQLDLFLNLFKKFSSNNPNIDIFIEELDSLKNSNFSQNEMDSLKKLQNKISSFIIQWNQNSFSLLFFMIVIFLLLIKIIGQLYYIHNYLFYSYPKNIFLFFSIFFTLFWELFMIYIFSEDEDENLLKVLIFSRISINIFLSFCVVIYYIIFGIDNSFLILALIFSFSPIASIIQFYEPLSLLKFYLNKVSFKTKLIDAFINYPTLIFFILYKLYKVRNSYFDSTHKKYVRSIIIILTVITILIMIMFDLTASTSLLKSYNNRYTSIVLVFLSIILISISSFFVPSQKKHNLTIAMFGTILFIFFICDVTERLLILLILIPIYEILHSCYNKSNNLYWKMLITCAYIIFADIFYVITKNTLTFNYSSEILMSNEKSYIIQFLYIAHKFRFFFITSIYLASHSNYSKNDFLDNTTRLTRILLDIQISGYEIFYAFYLFNEIEEAYLYIFMITMSKCYMAFIYDINVIIGYYIRKLVFKEKRLLDNTENDPIPIALSETSSIKNGKKIEIK